MPRPPSIRLGTTYGYLRALKVTGIKGHRRVYLVQCACGKRFEVIGRYLRAHSRVSCGCKRPDAHRADLKGRRFGGLKAMHVDRSSRPHRTRWMCLCRCGQSVAVDATNLTSGRTRSCGCGRFGP